MVRGRKKQQNISLEKQLAAVEKQIENTSAKLKVLHRQKKEIELKIRESKKDELYNAVLASGKTIDEILTSLTDKAETNE